MPHKEFYAPQGSPPLCPGPETYFRQLYSDFVSSCNSYHILVRYIYVFVIDQFFPCVASVPVPAERNIGPREGVFAFGTRGKWGENKKSGRRRWLSLHFPRFLLSPHFPRVFLAALYFARAGTGRLLRRQINFKLMRLSVITCGL